MKITIDTQNKTIKVEEAVNAEELHKELVEMFGKKLKEYTLLAVLPTISNPVYVPYPVYPLNPVWISPPHFYPVNHMIPSYIVTCEGGTAPMVTQMQNVPYTLTAGNT